MTRAVRFQGPGPGIRIGRLEDDAVWDAGAAPAVGFAPTAEAWERVRAASGACFRLDQVRLLAPVVPPKLICIGLNYRLHAEETGAAIPTEPVVFCKLPNSYTGPGDVIVLPKDDASPDYEAEMALVIGTRIRRADRASARAAIGGITALNDVSARVAQRSSGGQFVRGKSFDTFAPLGPCIVDASELDPNNLGVRLTLSGELMQDSNTVGHDLRRRGPDRLHLGGDHAGARRRDRHRHAERRRHGPRPEALAAPRATLATSEIEGVGVLSNPCVAEA